MKLRIGLVGLGSHWDTRHKPALRALSTRFEIRAVFDQVSHRAKRAADEFGACAVEGYRSLICRPDIDAVLVLDRQWNGMLPVLAACDANRAIYCAAPWEVELDAARRLRDRIDSAGVAFVTEFDRRYTPATLRLKELIATTLGPPRMLFCHQRLPTEECLSQDHRGSSSQAAWSGLVTLVDWCFYVVNEAPLSVVGVGHQPQAKPGPMDYEMMNLEFAATRDGASGAIAQISCGRYVSPRWPEALTFRTPAPLQVVCANGIAFVDLPATVTWFDEAGRHTDSLESERPAGEQMLAQFHREVTSLVRNTRSLDDTYRAVAIVALARESQREGRRMRIEC